ncbi:MAG: hypothetical protein V3574_05535 [Candidatus Moraniibacteriota bacterium]
MNKKFISNNNYKKIIKIFILIFIIFFWVNHVSAEALNLPKDTGGWTIFTPSVDTRIMYVSATGNDSTGTVYTSANHPDWSNPQNPSGTINSFATYEEAYAHSRDGYPDWILFKRGDTFYGAIGGNIRSGRNSSEPFFIGSYGSSGLSSILKVGSSVGIRINKESLTPGTLSFIAIQGIQIYSHTRNPSDPDYISSNGGRGLSIMAYNPGNIVSNILIEGCTFSYGLGNISVQSENGAEKVNNIEIRRNKILNAYSETSHAQGLFAAGVDNLIIEENIFDHNGWLIQSFDGGLAGGQGTMHNHNMYFDGVINTTVEKNIIMRASSIGTKFAGGVDITGLIVNDNLYIDNEIGIDACNNYHSNYYRIKSPIVSNNVFYKFGLSAPTNRGVKWGMWIQGWDGGDLANNLFIDNSASSIFFQIGERSRGINIFDNILKNSGTNDAYMF